MLVRRCTLVALLAIQFEANHGLASLSGRNPLAIKPWWVVSYMLKVAAVQLSNPVIFVITMVPDYWRLHVNRSQYETAFD